LTHGRTGAAKEQLVLWQVDATVWPFCARGSNYVAISLALRSAALLFDDFAYLNHDFKAGEDKDVRASCALPEQIK